MGSVPLSDIIGFGPVTLRDGEGRIIGTISVPALLDRKPVTARRATPSPRPTREYYADVPAVRKSKGYAGTASPRRARTKTGVVAA